MDSQNTDQKLAVITGGASGIGLSCSKRFAKEGYAVLIIDANKEAGEKELKSLKSDGYNSDFAYCDITKHEQVAACTSRRHWGGRGCHCRRNRWRRPTESKLL